MKLCECGCGQPNNGRGAYRWGHRPKETLPAIDAMCACGCGQKLVDSRKGRYTQAQYIRGHASRGKPSPKRYVPEPHEIPSGLCECGCGEATEIATTMNKRLRYFPGHPKPYIRGHHGRLRKGIPHPSPRPKPERKREAGYVLVRCPEHPNVPKDGYMFEHRLVWEATHGRLLERHLHVHHINGIRDDNRPENLVALTRAEHRRLHADESGPVSDETRHKLSTAMTNVWKQRREQGHE